MSCDELDGGRQGKIRGTAKLSTTSDEDQAAWRLLLDLVDW
jgi:hypothetical protein